MDEPSNTAVGYFNYAHSFAESAVSLQNQRITATHPDAPIRFLFAHAIELYLKSYLITNNVSMDDLQNKFRHNLLKLANKSNTLGLGLDQADLEIFKHLNSTDNAITSRYIRIGAHKVSPLEALHHTCCRLHSGIVEAAYKDSGVTRRPILSPSALSKLSEVGDQS